MSEVYKDIARTNVVFGGIKFLQVLVNILKTKIVAIYLGPVGVGIVTILLNIVTTLYQFTNLGIAQSSVRELSKEKCQLKKRQIITTINYLAIILGIIGSFICFLSANLLSDLMFGNRDYAWMIKILSFSLLFESITGTEISIFQGLRLIKVLAVSSLISSVCTLLISIPLYSALGQDGIPYSLLLGFFIGALVYWLIRTKKIKANKISKKEFLSIASPILSLGIVLMLSAGIMSIFSLITTTFINRFGSSEDVGLYSAASTCTYSAINIIIAILTSDFYPRLSGIIHKKNEAWDLVNSQIDLIISVLAPIVIVILIWPSIFLRLLYSDKFIVATTAVQIMALSLFFRVIWHCFSFVILAEGDKRRYFIFDACIGNGIFMIFNILGFWLNGVNGVAFSFVISSILICAFLYLIVKRAYGFYIDKHFWKFSMPVIILSVLLYFLIRYKTLGQYIISYILIGFLIFIWCILFIESKTSFFKYIICRISSKIKK